MIVFIGPDVVNIEPGDEVLIRPYSGREVMGRDGTIYHIMSADDVIALVSEKERVLKPTIQVQYEQQRMYDEWFAKNSKTCSCTKD